MPSENASYLGDMVGKQLWRSESRNGHAPTDRPSYAVLNRSTCEVSRAAPHLDRLHETAKVATSKRHAALEPRQRIEDEWEPHDPAEPEATPSTEVDATHAPAIGRRRLQKSGPASAVSVTEAPRMIRVILPAFIHSDSFLRHGHLAVPIPKGDRMRVLSEP